MSRTGLRAHAPLSWRGLAAPLKQGPRVPAPQTAQYCYSSYRFQMLVYSNKSLIRKEKKQKAPHVFYLCHHEKRDYSFNGFRVNKAASESKTPVSIKGALPFRLSPGSAGRPQHGMWCQQLFSAAWLALQRCTNLIRGWDELCNACRQMIISGGWQYLILQNFIAEANEKFKKEDEKEEEIRKWNASKNKSKKKKKPTTSNSRYNTTLLCSPLALPFLRCTRWGFASSH